MKKFDFLAAISIFLFTLTIYILTLSRSVYFGDSGEFIAVAATLGIAHPPGYPLYTMLAHLFTYLPFENLAFKVNLFSAVTSSLTAVVIYLICLKLTKNIFASITAALFLSFSYLFWLYSTVADTYSLNAFFISILVLISLHLFENPKNFKLIFLLGAIFGLSLAHHAMILFLTPALVFLFLTGISRQILKPKNLLIAALLFSAGLLPYLYLPIRAIGNPALNWGDPDTPSKFLAHVLRKDYGGFALSAGTANNPFNFEILGFYFSSLSEHFVVIGVIFAIIGAIFTPKTKQYIFLLLAYLSLGPILIFLTKIPPENVAIKAGIGELFSASHLIVGLLVGLGLAEIIKRAPSILKLPANFLIFLFFVPLIFNFQKVNQSKNFIYYEFGQQVFAELPANSLFITLGDKGTMISRYLQIGQGIKPDVKFANINFLSDLWYQENLQQRYDDFSFPFEKFTSKKLSHKEVGEIICKEVVPKIPTFIEDRTEAFNPNNNKNCSYHPAGPIIRLDLPQNRTTKEELEAQDKNFWQPFEEKLKKNKKPDDLRSRTILYGYSSAKTFLGILLNTLSGEDAGLKAYLEAFEISNDNGIAAQLAAQKYFGRKEFDNATEFAKKAAKIEPYRDQPYKILGNIYLNENNDKKQALFYYRKYLKLAPTGKEKLEVEKIVKSLETKL